MSTLLSIYEQGVQPSIVDREDPGLSSLPITVSDAYLKLLSWSICLCFVVRYVHFFFLKGEIEAGQDAEKLKWHLCLDS